LVAPQRKQLYTFGADYQLNKNTNILTEVALSNTDLNTFSELNAEDNVGIAVRSRVENEWKIGRRLTVDGRRRTRDSVAVDSLSPTIHRPPSTLTTFVDYEFTDANFRRIDPYRAIEFLRDWNTDRTVRIDEHLLNTGVNLEKKGLGNIRYTLGNYADFSKTFAKLNNLKIGVYGEREDNQRYATGRDTMQLSSFKFDILKAYLQTGESQTFQWRTEYTRRYDYLPNGADFGLATVADEVNLKGLWARYKHSRLNWNLTYRNMRADSILSQEKSQET